MSLEIPPVVGARRVRFWARLAALALAVTAWTLGGDWALTGAVLGALAAEVNLSLLVRALERASQWQGRSLKGTLARFYLIFAVTALLCVLVVRCQWGHPLAFLAGLLCPVPGLVLALLSFAVSPPRGPGHGH